MQSLQKFRILNQRKQYLQHCIYQNNEYSQFLDNTQNMQYVLPSTQNVQQEFRKLLKNRTLCIIDSLKSQVQLMDELERVYKSNDQLEIYKNDLEKDKQRLIQDQKKLSQINLELEIRCQQLIKFVKQQQQKIKQYQVNQQKLIMEKSQINKNLQEYQRIQKDNKQKTQAQSIPSSNQKIISNKEELDESIKQINNKFSKLKQASIFIRNKLIDQNLKFKKRYEKSHSLNNQGHLFSSVPVNLIRQKKFSNIIKNFHLNLKPNYPQHQEFKFKRCQSITEEYDHNNEIKVMDQSQLKGTSHNLKQQFEDLKMNINKPISVYTINNEDEDEINRSKYEFSTRIQSNIKESSQIGVIKSQSALSDISDIQKTVSKTKNSQYLSHVHSVITDFNHQKQCVCKKVTNKLKSAHNLMFNFIVKDRIQPRRTFRKNKMRLLLQAQKIK